MNKKAITILGIILLLILGTLGYLLYTRYFASPAPETPPLTNNNPPAETPSTTPPDNTQLPPATSAPSGTPASGVIKLADGPVVSPVLFYNGTGVSFFNNQGQLYQASVAQNSGQLQLSQLHSLDDVPVKNGISKILWPSRGDGFIAEFNNAGIKSWSSYNGQTNTYTDLPPQIQNVAWMPDGDKIVYVWYDNGKASLSIANPDTTGYQSVGELYYPDDVLSVSPDGLYIAFYREKSPDLANPINSVSPDGKLWKTFVKDGYNYGVLWSPDSKKFLFGRLDSITQRYQLWYYDLLSGAAKDLGVFTTIDKASWSGDSQFVYAAVPVSGIAGNGLTVDTFYKIDINTLNKQEMNPGSQTIDGRDLFLSSDGSQLLFKNAQDSGLYYINTGSAAASSTVPTNSD
jgi:hypothetical protein